MNQERATWSPWWSPWHLLLWCHRQWSCPQARQHSSKNKCGIQWEDADPREGWEVWACRESRGMPSRDSHQGLPVSGPASYFSPFSLWGLEPRQSNRTVKPGWFKLPYASDAAWVYKQQLPSVTTRHSPNSKMAKLLRLQTAAHTWLCLQTQGGLMNKQVKVVRLKCRPPQDSPVGVRGGQRLGRAGTQCTHAHCSPKCKMRSGKPLLFIYSDAR